MGSSYKQITPEQEKLIRDAKLFFVASVASDLSGGPEGQGPVNISPKGGTPLHVIDEHRVAYLDYVGSGAETIAHLRENGRIVIMWCAFQGPPKIIRFHGRGMVLLPDDAEYRLLRPLFPADPSGRAIITVSIDRIADSCGFGVPLYEFTRQRSQLPDWVARKGEDGLRAYQAEKNASSIDGLPAVRTPE